MLHQPFMIIANYKLIEKSGHFAAHKPFAKGTGRWEGLTEPCAAYLIATAAEGDLNSEAHAYTEKQLLWAAADIGERYVVVVDASRIAHLVATEQSDGVPDVRLGQWQEVTEAEALQLDGWSLLDGRYFATR